MYPIDRSVAIVKPKAPFLEWIESLPGSELDITLDQLRVDSTVYLIPDFEELEEALASIDDIYAQIFEAELAEWSEDENTWPKDRTVKLFWKWFDVSFHSLVVDTAEDIEGPVTLN